MPDLIQLLPDAVANQIAAGEVIQRPASVVKELVENAIDAGATSIQLIVKDAGKTLIQVIDNGCGMSDTDLRMSFERHATSKIRQATDLFGIRTMGFRGEALASIAAVAHVDVKSRLHDEELGCEISIAASEVIRQENVQCQAGTNFLVKNLFFNIPARRKFLKSNSTELKHIINEFQRVAFTYPEIAFQFSHNNTELYHLQASNRLRRIEQLTRKNISQQLVKIETETSIVSISGYIGKPEFARKQAGEQFFFVNQRYMRHPYFHKAVIKAYEQILGNSLWPSYFIYFEIDPSAIDINIHPTKTEIKFEDENNIWRILNISVKEAIGKFNLNPSIDFSSEKRVHIPVPEPGKEISAPSLHINPEYNPFDEGSRKGEKVAVPQFKKEIPQNWEELYSGFENKNRTIHFDNKAGAPENENELSLEIQNSLFQFKNRYILSQVKSGLMIIDQRRAHIRILFERFLERIKKQKSLSQQLLFPETLTLNIAQAVVFKEIKNSLSASGFRFGEQNQENISITALPPEFSGNPIRKINDLLDSYHEALPVDLQDRHVRMAWSLAKAGAQDYGTSLSPEEMRHLVDELFACKVPGYLPNKKLIFRIINMNEFENLLNPFT